METPTSTPSFIPRDNLATSSRRFSSAAGLPEVFMLFSVLILVVSGGLAGAVFLYQQYLQTNAKSKVSQLGTVEAAFQPALIVQLERLDDRMSAAQTLLHNHLALTSLFKILEQSTGQNISFSSFTFEGSDPTHMSIHMAGVAASVNSVALQSDHFGKSSVFASAILSGVNRQTDGVHFDFSALVNPTAVNYIQSASAAASTGTSAQSVPQTVQQLAAQQQTQQPPVAATTSTQTQPQPQNTPAATSSPFQKK